LPDTRTKKFRRLWPVMGTGAHILSMFLVGVALTGCTADRTAGPEPLPPPVAARPAAPPAPETVGEGRRPAALFVEFVATPQDVVERMLEMARIHKNDVVYDLGCGDGRIVITAAGRYGCRAVGYDLDPLRVREARENAARHRVSHLVTIEQKDILHVDLQGASVVTLYLGTEINARLIPQLEKLRPGTRIVSHDFPLGDLLPEEVVEMTSREDSYKHMLYLWTCPLTTDHR
jgi:SAM-dependent methyltransferase